MYLINNCLTNIRGETAWLLQASYDKLFPDRVELIYRADVASLADYGWHELVTWPFGRHHLYAGFTLVLAPRGYRLTTPDAALTGTQRPKYVLRKGALTIGYLYSNGISSKVNFELKNPFDAATES